MGLGVILGRKRSRGEKFYMCRECGKPFDRDKARDWARHCEDCANEHDAEHQARIEAEQKSIFTSFSDPEAMAWIRRRAAEGKKAAKHGRPA